MRQEGYYWVRFLGGNWTIAYWDGDSFKFEIRGLSKRFIDLEFSEIDERRIQRNERQTHKIIGSPLCILVTPENKEEVTS